MNLSTIYDTAVERVDEKAADVLFKSHKIENVCIYWGESPDKMDMCICAHAALENRIRISGISPEKRTYFEIRREGEEKGIVLGERKISCDGTFNLRDLGGYKTFDNREVKWGKLFRSDGFSGLSSKGMRQFANLGINQVFDFRSEEEVQNSPDRFPENSSPQYFHLPVIHGEFNYKEILRRLKSGDSGFLTDAYMAKGYIRGIENYPASWGKAFKQIVKNNGLPAVFHCTGGKDRTGTFSALLLLVLGVPEETIIYDHQLSNEYILKMLPYFIKSMEKFGIDAEIIKPYFSAPLEGIRTLLSHIESVYGGAVGYLTEKCSIKESEIRSLKEKLLTV